MTARLLSWYNDVMLTLIACAFCALASLAASVVAFFSLPGWRLVSGLSRLPVDRAPNVDSRRLRRSLAIVFAFLALALASMAVVLALRLVPQALALPALCVFALVSYDAAIVVWRSCDRNPYPEPVRRSSRIVALSGNAVLLALLALSFL